MDTSTFVALLRGVNVGGKNTLPMKDLADLCTAAGLMARDRIRIVQAGAVLGTHVGPGALALTGMLK